VGLSDTYFKTLRLPSLFEEGWHNRPEPPCTDPYARPPCRLLGLIGSYVRWILPLDREDIQRKCETFGFSGATLVRRRFGPTCEVLQAAKFRLLTTQPEFGGRRHTQLIPLHLNNEEIVTVFTPTDPIMGIST
jgi:hypothetical protein